MIETIYVFAESHVSKALKKAVRILAKATSDVALQRIDKVAKIDVLTD